MGRILFFVFLVFVVWLAVRVLGGSRKRAADAPAEPPPAARSIESVTQCAWCGVHVPQASALSLPDGRIYCSEAHREAARAAASTADRSRS